MDEKVKEIAAYCKVVRENISLGMEVSPGFIVLLENCEYLLSLPSLREKKMEKPKDTNVEEFINHHYWENPEDAIGDIRKFITEHSICDKCSQRISEHDDGECLRRINEDRNDR
jgi:hypothetical protein